MSHVESLAHYNSNTVVTYNCSGVNGVATPSGSIAPYTCFDPGTGNGQYQGLTAYSDCLTDCKNNAEKQIVNAEKQIVNELPPPITVSSEKVISPCPPNFRMIKSWDVGGIDYITGLPSTTPGESPGIAFGLVPNYTGWSVQEPHYRCIGFNGIPQGNYATYKPPLVGQCFTVLMTYLFGPLHGQQSAKTFRITEVLPGNTNTVNGGHSIAGYSTGGPFCRLANQTAQAATIPIISFNRNHPQFWPGLSTGCTNLPCGQECDQSLTAFNPIQTPQYGCNYQATQFQGDSAVPCLQIDSCIPGHIWSPTLCKCIPDPQIPLPKLNSGQGATIKVTNNNFISK